jgi:hypothetical protein
VYYSLGAGICGTYRNSKFNGRQDAGNDAFIHWEEKITLLFTYSFLATIVASTLFLKEFF